MFRMSLDAINHFAFFSIRAKHSTRPAEPSTESNGSIIYQPTAHYLAPEQLCEEGLQIPEPQGHKAIVKLRLLLKVTVHARSDAYRYRRVDVCPNLRSRLSLLVHLVWASDEVARIELLQTTQPCPLLRTCSAYDELS